MTAQTDNLTVSGSQTAGIVLDSKYDTQERNSPQRQKQEPEWRQTRTVYDRSEEEVGSSRPIQQDTANIFISKDADDSHRKDKQGAGRKRQAAEMASDDKAPETALTNQNPTTANLTYDVKNLPAFVWCKNEANLQRVEVAKPSPYVAGYLAKLGPSTSQGKSLQKIIMNQITQESPTGGG